MKTILKISLLFILLFGINLFAQEDKVDVLPKPIGGIEAMIKNVVYPQSAKEAGIEGKVYVQAFIDENGNVANAKIIRGIGAGCDEAALDAIKKTKFTPAMKEKKPVKAEVTIPVMFKLS